MATEWHEKTEDECSTKGMVSRGGIKRSMCLLRESQRRPGGAFTTMFGLFCCIILMRFDKVLRAL